MFPWNYGFHWNAGTMVFMGAFYGVLVLVAATVTRALLRSRRSLRQKQVEGIAWQESYHDLPTADQDCRHVLTGEFQSRKCPDAFDCRQCKTHAKWIETHPVPDGVGSDASVCGMAFPLDRFYHRGHTWVKVETDGTLTIGLDDLARRMLGTPDTLELPARGAHLAANGTAFRVSRRNADVRVLAPAGGEVLATGGPTDGWYLKLRPLGGPADLSHLLRGTEVRAWVMHEMERLQLALASEGRVPTLADGGVPVDDIAASYPQADWDAVCGKMLLEP